MPPCTLPVSWCFAGRSKRRICDTMSQVRLAQAAMAHHDTSVSERCAQLGIKSVTLYRYVGPQGQLREENGGPP